MIPMTAAAISFAITALIPALRVPLRVHMGIMIGFGILAFIRYIFLREDFYNSM